MALTAADFCGRTILTDGDFRHELVLRGWPGDAAAATAYLEWPEQCQAVIDAFLRAGADFVLTATDDAQPFARAGSPQTEEDLRRFDRINASAALISRQAVVHAGAPGAGRVRRVIGVLGPPAAVMSVEGLDPQRLGEAYRRQAVSLAEGGAEAILCRSFSELDAFRIALEAARLATGLPVIGSMRFDSGVDRSETTLGVSIPQACDALVSTQAIGVGCDGAEDPDALPQIAQRIRQSTSLPIWIGLNAGWPEWSDDGLGHSDSPEKYAARALPLVEAGVAVIGGGSGATVDHVAAMASVLIRRES